MDYAEVFGQIFGRIFGRIIFGAHLRYSALNIIFGKCQIFGYLPTIR